MNPEQTRSIQQAYQLVEEALKIVMENGMSTIPGIRNIRAKTVDALNSLNGALQQD